MEKYSIKKKVDHEIDLLLSTVRDFAVKELFELIKTEQCLVYPVTDKSLIAGRYHINFNELEQAWVVSNYYDEIIHNFYSKSTAVYYAIAMIKQKYTLADDLLKKDKIFQSSRAEFILYDGRLKTATKTNDDFKLNLYVCKFEEARSKLKRAVNELEKTLKTAKYLNKSGI